MNFSDISHFRLANQQVMCSNFQSPENLLQWMGAIQAQHYEMAKWALGVRLRRSTHQNIEKAIEDGRIIRTHLLRPTWHFVAAEDLRWMVNLTAPRIRTAMRSRHKQLGLTKDIISKSNKILEKILSVRNQMTRKELVDELKKAGYKNEDNLASHLLLSAELDKVICSGPSVRKDYTYALFEERVPSSANMTKEEAMAKLAKNYFTSHGPATLDDFIWWSGLTKTGAKQALGFVKDKLVSGKIDSQTYWFSEPDQISQRSDQSVYLLPSYDEFLIGYKDRRPSIRIKAQKKAISNNGIFRPIIVVNGEVVGIWKRSVQKETVYVETQFFANPPKATILRVEEAAKKIADFLGKKLKINHLIDS